MSDDSRDQSQPSQPAQPVPDGWGAPISEARQAELMALAERQRGWAAQPEDERGDIDGGGSILRAGDRRHLYRGVHPPRDWQLKGS